ncbi:MAG: hypothetical protein WC465_03280 [Patescibacteria group bacterium]
MIYELKVRVDGHSTIRDSYIMNVDPYLLKIDCNEYGGVDYLSVGVRVKDFRNYLPKLNISKDDRAHTLNIPDNHFHADIINLLQHIESLGSFWLGVKKIYWDNPISTWIPENEEEEKILKNDSTINGYSFDKKYEPNIVEFSSGILRQIIDNRNFYKRLVIPLSFYREGRNEFESKRYIQAFYNFYFYLEDLYGNGKTKNNQIENEFLNSKQFVEAVEETLVLFSTNGYEKHFRKLQELLSSKKYDYRTEGVVKLIVSIRGNLHHFSQKSTLRLGHYFNQEEFKTMAFLLMSICLKTFTYLTTGVNPE